MSLVVSRTTSQLAATPSSADLAAAAPTIFYDSTDPSLLYRISSAGQYAKIVSPNVIFLGNGSPGMVNDGSTDITSVVQAAVDKLNTSTPQGGTLIIGPSLPNIPWQIGMVIHYPCVEVMGCGKGVTVFSVIDHLPLRQLNSRVEVPPGSGNWVVAVQNAAQRAVFYTVPVAPFATNGMTNTISSKATSARFSNFTAHGNKNSQDGPVSLIYAAPGSSDPEWARVSGAYGSPGYPSGTINLSAMPAAYDCFETLDVEADNFSGTPFFGDTDRQRGKLDRGTRGVSCGILNSDGSILYDAAGYEFYGNDCVVCTGTGFGSNTSPVKMAASGALKSHLNATSQRGPNSALAVLDLATNGANTTSSVLQAGYRAQVSSGGTYAPKGVVLAAIDGRLDESLHIYTYTDPLTLIQYSSAPSGNPFGVTDDSHNAYAQFQGYRQVVCGLNAWSADKNGKSFKYHASAIASAGVRYSGVASSETGVQSYVGSSPFFTDNTGSIGYDYYDSFTKQLHLGVHTNNVTTAGTIVFDSPVTFAAGVTLPGVPISGTWSSIVALMPADGTMAYATDLGPAGMNFVYRSSSAKWTPVGGSQCLYQAFNIVGTAGNTEQLMVAIPLPAKILQNQLFEITVGTTNNGTTDAEAVVAVRLNSTASVGTPGVGELCNFTGLTAAQASSGRAPMQFLATQNTVIKKQGTAGAGNASFGAQTSSAAVTSISVPTLASSQFLCVVIQMAGITDIPTLSYIRVDMMSA